MAYELRITSEASRLVTKDKAQDIADLLDCDVDVYHNYIEMSGSKSFKSFTVHPGKTGKPVTYYYYPSV